MARLGIRRLLPRKAQLILLVCSFLFIGLLIEGLARLWLGFVATPEQQAMFALHTDIERKDFQWSPHPYLNYYPTPDYRKDQLRHNALGYRGDEIAIPKEPRTYRIAVLGGSTVYTTQVNDNAKTFTAQLQSILSKTVPGRRVEVINGGAGGYNSWESLVNLQFRILDLEPDLVIVYHATNDVRARLVQPASYRGDNTGRRRQWTLPDVSWLDYSAAMRIVRRKLGSSHRLGLASAVNAPTTRNLLHEPEELLRLNPPIYFRRNLENMVAIARAHNVRILFATWTCSPEVDGYHTKPYYQAAFREHNDITREVGRRLEVPVFDFDAAMPKDAKYWADGVHVNEEGARLKAQKFADYILAQDWLR